MQSLISLMSLLLSLSMGALMLATVFFSGNIKDAYYRDHIGSAVVRIYNPDQTSGGTGFHVEAESGKTYILTNKHICEIAQNGKLLVEQNGEEMIREVVKKYDQHDLCLVQAMPDAESSLEIAGELDKGEDIVVIGHPGLRDLTLSMGEFIGPDEVEILNLGIQKEEDCHGQWYVNPLLMYFLGREAVCIESSLTSAISAPIYGGNSGSPVVNKYGNVVGVVFAGSNEQVHDAHMVPLKNVKDFLKGY